MSERKARESGLSWLKDILRCLCMAPNCMISESDIMECAASAQKVVFQQEKGKWKVNESDPNGDYLIVTMYRKS